MTKVLRVKLYEVSVNGRVVGGSLLRDGDPNGGGRTAPRPGIVRILLRFGMHQSEGQLRNQVTIIIIINFISSKDI